VDEYLQTSFRPDRDYVDGVVEERNLGEKDHSRVQVRLAAFLFAREKPWKICAFTEQRVQVSPTRFRIPDVCVTLGEPAEQVLRTPPFLCVEILSPEDTVTRLQQRIDDYIHMGVAYVWVIDPQERRAWVYTPESIAEAKGGLLQAGKIEVPMSELFPAELSREFPR
jgi:Uma2 family endonuclease